MNDAPIIGLVRSLTQASKNDAQLLQTCEQLKTDWPADLYNEAKIILNESTLDPQAIVDAVMLGRHAIERVVHQQFGLTVTDIKQAHAALSSQYANAKGTVLASKTQKSTADVANIEELVKHHINATCRAIAAIPHLKKRMSANTKFQLGPAPVRKANE